MDVGEVAPSAAGDENLSPRLRILFKQQYPTSSVTRDRGAHQPRSARTKNDDIKLLGCCRHYLILSPTLMRFADELGG